MVKNDKGWKILAKNGFESFAGIANQGKKEILEIRFTDKTSVKVSLDHVLFSLDCEEVSAKTIVSGDKVLSTDPKHPKTVQDVFEIDGAETFDIIETESNTYFSNGILSHNCHFLSSDVTLIDNFALTQIEKKLDDLYKSNGGEPIIEMTVADVDFFKKPKKSLAYIVSVDVSTGSGKDYSVIQITEFPTMQQVGQFRSNQTSEKFLYSKLKNILLFLEQNSKEVYFSVENNGVGSSILAMYEFDDRPPTKSYLISDSIGNRLGITMSEQVKRRTALKLKSMVETEAYKILCPVLINEFKNYTRQGATFKAEAGATDDIIASLLIMVRILEEMADFNPYAYEKVYNAKGYDDKQDEWEETFVENPNSLDDAPMPIVF